MLIISGVSRRCVPRGRSEPNRTSWTHTDTHTATPYTKSSHKGQSKRWAEAGLLGQHYTWLPRTHIACIIYGAMVVDGRWSWSFFGPCPMWMRISRYTTSTILSVKHLSNPSQKTVSSINNLRNCRANGGIFSVAPRCYRFHINEAEILLLYDFRFTKFGLALRCCYTQNTRMSNRFRAKTILRVDAEMWTYLRCVPKIINLDLMGFGAMRIANRMDLMKWVRAHATCKCVAFEHSRGGGEVVKHVDSPE